MKVIINQELGSKIDEEKLKKVILFLGKKEKKIKGEIEINIVSNRTIKVFNKVYRGINRPTDVLSFAWQEDKKWPTTNLGQIYLSIDKIRGQAKEFKVTLEEEMYRMLIHGILHIIGYDHNNAKATKIMFEKQEWYLKKVLKMI